MILTDEMIKQAQAGGAVTIALFDNERIDAIIERINNALWMFGAGFAILALMIVLD